MFCGAGYFLWAKGTTAGITLEPTCCVPPCLLHLEAADVALRPPGLWVLPGNACVVSSGHPGPSVHSWEELVCELKGLFVPSPLVVFVAPLTKPKD